jgi:octaprenyl-diphosphate synthase
MLSQDLNKILQIINEYISELLPQNELKNFLLNGSKLMRSKLAILYFRAQNYEINDDFLKILAAGELIHNASLLHDDVIYNSELRRGRTTIVKKYSSDISVLCGDYVVSKAIELLLKINNYEILSIFNNCVQNMTQAEVKQYLGRNTMSDREKYI